MQGANRIAKTSFVGFRLSADDASAIRRRAAAQHLSLSEYARVRMLSSIPDGAAVVATSDIRRLADTLDGLARAVDRTPSASDGTGRPDAHALAKTLGMLARSVANRIPDTTDIAETEVSDT